MRNLLLDKPFQLKYTLAVVLVSSVISAGLGTLLYQAHRESSQVASLDVDDPLLDSAMQDELRAEDRKVLFSLVIFLGGLVLSLTALGIVATHKIAGPAYAMRKKMSDIADGKLPIMHPLRRGDELQAVAEELRRMANFLRQQEEEDVEALSQIVESIRADTGNSEQWSAAIESMVQKKQQRLDDNNQVG